jgi:hypothetical protein
LQSKANEPENGVNQRQVDLKMVPSILQIVLRRCVTCTAGRRKASAANTKPHDKGSKEIRTALDPNQDGKATEDDVTLNPVT